MTQLQVGARYSSFEEFQAALAKFSRDTNSIYTVFNSKTVETENRHRSPEKHFPAPLKYKFIKYACKHYGSNRSKSRGLRPNQSSFKIGCPAYIYLSAHNKELVVEKMETEHSHACDPDIINFYPERRSITNCGRGRLLEDISALEDPEGANLIKSVREDVLDLLHLCVDRRRIRNYVRLRTNKVLTAVDLSNLAKQVQGQDRQISEERSIELLNKLTDLESKENTPARMLDEFAKKEKYKALKRKIAHVKADPNETLMACEADIGANTPEHGYSHFQRKRRKSQSVAPAKRQLVLQSNDVQSDELQWDASSIEEMVKNFINPSEEGPVVVHMNNYNGVMVVEIPDGQGSVTQLEGTVVEVDDEPVGEDSRVSEETLEESKSLPHPEEGSVPPNNSSAKPLKVKKILQFKKRQSPSDLSPEQVGDTKEVIDLAMEETQEMEKSHRQDGIAIKQQLDDNSNSESGDMHCYVDCPSGNEFDDAEDTYTENAVENSQTVNNSERLIDLAERLRWEAETEMLKVKTDKLKLQVKYLQNELDKQGLEKEKLRLEIALLKARIGVSER